MLTSPRELCRPRLCSAFPGVEVNGNAIEDSDDKASSLLWCQIIRDEVLVNAQTKHCPITAKSFDLNDNHGSHYSSSNLL
jgi:hypothetical protein